MKTDRISAVSTRATAVLLACFLFAAGRPADGQITFRLGGTTLIVESSSKRLAKAVAKQVGEVQRRFDENRQALHTLQGAGGEPAYPVREVAGLIARTGEDLDQAIEQVGEPGLEGLSAWSVEKLQSIQEQLKALSVQTAALSSDLSTPRAVAVVASLEWHGSPGLAKVSSAPPKPETVSAETSNRLLDQVGEVVNRIFFLASHDDLEVKLWAGSTPAQKTTFRFRPQGQIKGSTPAPTIIQTNGKRDHVLRGLYVYEAAWAKGAVTELIKYPNPAGASAAGLASERLDLVNGSSFFCCRFDEQYCQHVASEKECRP